LSRRSAMGKPMRPVPIQPILCAFFDITKFSRSTSGADERACRGFSRSAAIAPVRRVRSCLSRAFKAHYPRGQSPYVVARRRWNAITAEIHGRNTGAMQDAVTTIAVTGGSDAQGDDRLRLIWRNIFPFIVVGAIWEIVAWTGVFPRRLFPPLEEVAASF